MADNPTPLDLDAIPALAAECDLADRDMRKRVRCPVKHLRSLLAEVERLRAEVASLRQGAQVLRGWITEHEETIVETSDALDEARLTARPAPAWDEDAVASTIWEASRKDEGTISAAGARLVARAVVREHLPIKPDRKAVGAAIRHALKTRTSAHFGLSEYDLADVALSLLPGRSEAEVKAEAWDAGYESGVRAGERDVAINPYREGGAS